MCYFFYKNVTFGITVFLFEANTSFSGQPAYNDWYMSLYNVLFTSLPAMALGVFDQDVSPRFCIKFPQLYQEGVQNVLFSWKRILSWMFNGVCNAIVIFFFCTSVLETQAFRKGGQIVELQVLGTTMYSCVVWVVNCQMALSVSYFTLIQHIIVWGSILLWYIFLFAYGSMPPRISTTAYKVFLEACMLAPSYWLVILLVVFSALLPFFLYSAISMQFFPMYHQMIQWKRLKSNSDDPENRPIEPTSTTASEIRR